MLTKKRLSNAVDVSLLVFGLLVVGWFSYEVFQLFLRECGLF